MNTRSRQKFLEIVRSVVRVVLQEVRKFFDRPPAPPSGASIVFTKEIVMLVGTVKLSGPVDSDVAHAHLIVQTQEDGIQEFEATPPGGAEFFTVGEDISFADIRVTKNAVGQLSGVFADKADNHSALFITEFTAVLTDTTPPASPSGITVTFDREE